MSVHITNTGFALAPELERCVGRWLERLAKALAVFGGLVLVGLILLSVVSITGRGLVGLELGLGPVPGDFEIIEVGCAFAVFSFLPWCQMRRGHVSVDVLVRSFSRHARIALELAGNLLMTVAACLIAWRLVLGMVDKQRYGETTFILQFPAWWGYAASLSGAILFAVIAAYSVWRSFNELSQGTGEDGVAGAPSR